MSSLPPAEVQYQESHLYQNQTHQLSAFFIVCVVVSLICMIARVASRKVTDLGFKIDDYAFLTGAALAEGSFIVLMIYSFKAGLGEHWVALNPTQLRLFPKLNYAYNILNLSCYPLLKISILLLYNRIFIVSRFHKIVRTCLVIVIMIGISTTLVAIFACSPIRGFYDSSIKARCVNDKKFYWATACLNVITDSFILILPMPMVWRLQTTLKRKIGLSILFIIGGLTFIVSIVRIVYYLRFNAEDSSYSFIGDAYSTAAEVCLAIICASAPTWRPLFRSILEHARSHFHALKSDGNYGDLEKQISSSGDDSINRQNSDYTLVESELLAAPASTKCRDDGRSDSVVYDARHNGLPVTQASAYSSQAGVEDDVGSDNHVPLPLGRINVKHEVKVEAGRRPM